MNLARLLNATTDCYMALRLAGWDADEASKIVTEAARNAVNRLPIRPYPNDLPKRTDDNGNESTSDRRS